MLLGPLGADQQLQRAFAKDDDRIENHLALIEVNTQLRRDHSSAARRRLLGRLARAGGRCRGKKEHHSH